MVALSVKITTVLTFVEPLGALLETQSWAVPPAKSVMLAVGSADTVQAAALSNVLVRDLRRNPPQVVF